jgi:hypothetical protein
MSAPALAITEEHRAEGLTAWIMRILDNPGIAPTSLPQYQEGVRDAFGTAAASNIQPGDCPCDWCGQGGSDPIDPQDGE